MCAMLEHDQDPDGLLAEVRREFCDGLPGRLETLETALERLAKGYDAGAADAFYRAAHSLKGTAASFEADELVGPATALADVGLGWFKGGALDSAALVAARQELERLRGAVKRYTARLAGGAAG